jgi:putative ABC transport system ATP-binding protein
MIRIDELEFKYARSDFRLRVPQFGLEPRETVALIGPSGSGKTTLLNLVSGVLLPDAGRVVTHDTEVSALGDAARRSFRIRHIGMVFQEFELLDYLHVLDNILLPYRISRALELDQAVLDRAGRLAQDVGLGDKLRRHVGRLSQGERQRVAVCRALVTEPPLLLCDEPTGNLDPANKDQVLDILFDYVQGNGTTLLSVTHDHDVLGRFDRVIDIKDFGVVAGQTA